MHYSVKISHLVDQIKNLAQDVAILETEIDDLLKKANLDASQDIAPKGADVRPLASDTDERHPSA